MEIQHASRILFQLNKKFSSSRSIYHKCCTLEVLDNDRNTFEDV
jgi:hypothetical protein